MTVAWFVLLILADFICDEISSIEQDSGFDETHLDEVG